MPGSTLWFPANERQRSDIATAWLENDATDRNCALDYAVTGGYSPW